MECFGLFIVVFLAVGGIMIAIMVNMTAALERAKKAYLAALERLKADPHNPNLREEVLALGRKYSSLARTSPGVTLFDEVALMNDINAACARAGSIPVAQAVPVRQSIEERLVALDQLRAKQLITEEEYQGRRSKLLDEV